MSFSTNLHAFKWMWQFIFYKHIALFIHLQCKVAQDTIEQNKNIQKVYFKTQDTRLQQVSLGYVQK